MLIQIFQVFKNTFLTNYANYKGRVGLKEYWSFVAMFAIIYVVLILLSTILGIIANILATIMGIILTIYMLASLAPLITITIRRMHDIGKSGWFSLIPIYSLILAATAGNKGPNEYGEEPIEKTN